jgi:hypothetical protein
MQKDLILSDAAKETRRQKTAQNREKQKKVPQTKSLDLVSMKISEY